MITARITGLEGVFASFRALGDAVPKEEAKLLKIEGGALARESGAAVLPKGYRDGAGDQLRRRIRGAIRRLFPTPPEVYGRLKGSFPREAAALVRAWKEGDAKNFRKAARKMGLRVRATVPPQAYAAARTGKFGRVPKDAAPIAVLTDGARRERFIARVQKDVGKAKSGFIRAAQSVGIRQRNIPKWIQPGTHRKGSAGRGTLRATKRKGASLALENLVPYVGEDIFPKKAQKEAERRAARRYEKALRIALREAARKRVR